MNAVATEAPLAAQLLSSRQALAAHYTGRLAHADGNLGLVGFLIAVEAFHVANCAEAAQAPLTPPMLLQAVAFALEEHHASVLAQLDPFQQGAYVRAIEECHRATTQAAGPHWQAMKAAIEQIGAPELHTPPSRIPLFTALYRAVAAWLGRAGHAS